MAPQCANLFTVDLGQCFLKFHSPNPLCYLRFIHDILISWNQRIRQKGIAHQIPNSHQIIQKWISHQILHDVNNFYPTIILSLNLSTEQVHFLDITLKQHNGYVNATLYRKFTDCNAYQHASSVRSECIIKSITHNQTLCYNHISSDPLDRDAQLTELNQTFRKWIIHPMRSIDKSIELLNDKPQKQNNDKPFTYHSLLNPLKQIINKLQPILDNDTVFS